MGEPKCKEDRVVVICWLPVEEIELEKGHRRVAQSLAGRSEHLG